MELAHENTKHFYQATLTSIRILYTLSHTLFISISLCIFSQAQWLIFTFGFRNWVFRIYEYNAHESKLFSQWENWTFRAFWNLIKSQRNWYGQFELESWRLSSMCLCGFYLHSATVSHLTTSLLRFFFLPLLPITIIGIHSI